MSVTKRIPDFLASILTTIAFCVVLAALLGLVYFTVELLTTKAEVLVFISSIFATFVGMMLSDETNSRLKTGALSGLTGAAAGGVGALLEGDQGLLLVGLAGSGTGLFLGWATALILCTAAGYRRNDHLRYMLTYFTTGLSSLRDELNEDRRLMSDMEVVEPIFNWQEHFAYRVKSETQRLVEAGELAYIDTTIRSWLVEASSMLHMVFRITERPEYRPRFSLIKFDSSCLAPDARPEGYKAHGVHWIFEYADLKPYGADAPFTADSHAHQVCARMINSPHFSHTGAAGDARSASNTPYILFRVSSRLCLTVDWPLLAQLPSEARVKVPTNLFVQITKSLLEIQLTPGIRALYDRFRDEHAPFGGRRGASQPPAGPSLAVSTADPPPAGGEGTEEVA